MCLKELQYLVIKAVIDRKLYLGLFNNQTPHNARIRNIQGNITIRYKFKVIESTFCMSCFIDYIPQYKAFYEKLPTK
jgi:hypothetical protein